LFWTACLSVMRRDEGDKERLKAIVEGRGSGTNAH
jgi:hypothetical protein